MKTIKRIAGTALAGLAAIVLANAPVNISHADEDDGIAQELNPEYRQCVDDKTKEMRKDKDWYRSLSTDEKRYERQRIRNKCQEQYGTRTSPIEIDSRTQQAFDGLERTQAIDEKEREERIQSEGGLRDGGGTDEVNVGVISDTGSVGGGPLDYTAPNTAPSFKRDLSIRDIMNEFNEVPLYTPGKRKPNCSSKKGCFYVVDMEMPFYLDFEVEDSDTNLVDVTLEVRYEGKEIPLVVEKNIWHYEGDREGVGIQEKNKFNVERLTMQELRKHLVNPSFKILDTAGLEMRVVASDREGKHAESSWVPFFSDTLYDTGDGDYRTVTSLRPIEFTATGNYTEPSLEDRVASRVQEFVEADALAAEQEEANTAPSKPILALSAARINQGEGVDYTVKFKDDEGKVDGLSIYFSGSEVRKVSTFIAPSLIEWNGPKAKCKRTYHGLEDIGLYQVIIKVEDGIHTIESDPVSLEVVAAKKPDNFNDLVAEVDEFFSSGFIAYSARNELSIFTDDFTYMQRNNIVGFKHDGKKYLFKEDGSVQRQAEDYTMGTNPETDREVADAVIDRLNKIETDFNNLNWQDTRYVVAEPGANYQHFVLGALEDGNPVQLYKPDSLMGQFFIEDAKATRGEFIFGDESDYLLVIERNDGTFNYASSDLGFD